MAGMVADGITIKFSANTSGLTDGAKHAQDVLNNFGKLAGVALLAVGAAAVAGGVAATKMAGDFQAGMTSLVTGAGESAKNIKMVGAGILDMATQTGTSTKQLTDGMYMIESAGFHGAAGLEVLKNAAEGAKVGNADLKDVANGVTTALTDYNLPASQAAAVTNDLIATVANGKTTMGALSASLKSILPVASTAGISLNGVSAALATMTGQGVPAGEAANHLRLAIMALEAPSTKGAATLKSIGLSAQDVASEMKDSLPNALQMVTDHLKKKFPEGSAAYTAALKDISGGSGALSVMLGLTGDHMQTFKNNVDNVFNAVRSGGDSITGWADVQQNFNFKMDQAKEVVEALGIKLGTKLLPMVGQLLDRIMPVITRFGDWLITSGSLENGFNALVGAVSGVITVVSTVVGFFQQNHAALETLKAGVLVVAGVIGGALVFSFVAWATTIWTTTIPAMLALLVEMAPFLLIGALVGLIIFGVIEAFQHWGAITKWFQGIWAAVSAWFMGMLHAIGSFFVAIWTGMANFFIGLWSGIIAGLKAAWNFIVNVIKIGALLALAVLFAPIILMAAAFIWLYNHNYYFKALVDAIVGFFVGCFNWCRDNWQGFVNLLVGLWNGLVGLAHGAWMAVSGAIMGVIGFLLGWVRSQWDGAIRVLGVLWGTVYGIAQGAWDKVAGVFRGVWGTISGILGGLYNSFKNWFVDLAAQFLTWGANAIQGFVNGIISKVNNVASAVGGIAAKVLAFLGFHSPTKEGPGREADVWAPNFIKMYAKGLTDGLPQIQNAVNKLSTPLALNFNSKFQYPSAAATSSPQIVVHVHNDKAAPIYLDGHELTNRVAPHMANMIRLKGDVRSR